MTQGQVIAVVAPNGETRHLVDPVSERICAAVGPKMSTDRVSNVETWSSLSENARDWLCAEFGWGTPQNRLPTDMNLFWADMLPVDGPVLGPFQSHAQAIAAEVEWLSERNLPIPAKTAAG